MSETTIPIPWFDPIHRSLGHLAPDIIVRRGRSIHIVDAKYKFHLAELDRAGWHRFTEEARAAHRADVHQVLAYAALYDAEEITATLVIPCAVRHGIHLWNNSATGPISELVHGSRRILLELRGLPFGKKP